MVDNSHIAFVKAAFSSPPSAFLTSSFVLADRFIYRRLLASRPGGLSPLCLKRCDRSLCSRQGRMLLWVWKDILLQVDRAGRNIQRSFILLNLLIYYQKSTGHQVLQLQDVYRLFRRQLDQLSHLRPGCQGLQHQCGPYQRLQLGCLWAVLWWGIMSLHSGRWRWRCQWWRWRCRARRW